MHQKDLCQDKSTQTAQKAASAASEDRKICSCSAVANRQSRSFPAATLICFCKPSISLHAAATQMSYLYPRLCPEAMLQPSAPPQRRQS